MDNNNQEKKYYVDFGPELLQLLGPNLYTNIYYVLGEIIANAYDADASNVYILYNNNTNTIIIEDDGNGMSYEELNKKFLPIGISTRKTEKQSYTHKGRRKMGRKGIGKLAALSVAKNIRVLSHKNGEKSGCVLSLDLQDKNADGKYEIPSIDDNDINFIMIDDKSNGSAIVMENSRYSIHKSIKSAKKNISLIFPFASEDFRIHLYDLEKKKDVMINDSNVEIIKLADALMTFSDEGSIYENRIDSLHENFDDGRYFRDIAKQLSKENRPTKKILNEKYLAIKEDIDLENIRKEKKTYEIKIEGWIATYSSTSSKNKDYDFPSNHISIIANGKLGQLNILPNITTDRMAESYVVGQFFVDILEETELPDIAASNRQGYKEDDDRVIRMKSLIKENALKPILDLKKMATDEKNYLRNKKKEEDLKKSKVEMDFNIRKIVENDAFKSVINNSHDIRKTLETAWQLKDTINEYGRKVMISHCSENKDVSDEIEKVLLYCGFNANEIIYTSSDNYESGVPSAYDDLYDFLREFFVNTVKRNDLLVIYVLNQAFIKKWSPTLEAGAGWILNTHKLPLYTDCFESVKLPFEIKNYMPCIKYGMSEKEQHYFADAIHQACVVAKKYEKNLDEIKNYIKRSTKL